MSEAFVKYPRTPHLIWMGEATPRGDKLVNKAEAEALLRRPASIEEKVDGANLGLSLGSNGRLRAQSRGHYLEPGTAGQWKSLWKWLALRETQLVSVIGPSRIVFGEWCYAQHSVAYDSLPDWMLVFDVYDRLEGRFWSRKRRDALARESGLSTVPLLGEGRYTLESVRRHIGPSRIGAASAEGVYLRWDEGAWLIARAKVVKPGWVLATDEHWSSRPLKVNRLASDERTARRSAG